MVWFAFNGIGTERRIRKMNRSYYEELGVQPDATPDEIRNAYRRLAKKYHPDLNAGDRLAEERFKRLTEAYRILSDPSNRITFHQKEAVRTKAKAAAKNRQTDSFSELFKKVFKTGFGSFAQNGQSPRKGKDLQINLDLDPLDLSLGIQKKVMIKREQSCKVCSGSGMMPGTKPVQCSICLGIGEIPGSKGGKTVFEKCTNCHGTGQVIRERCLECGGKGFARTKSYIKIDIPKGIKPGATLTIQGYGDVGRGGRPSGDLKVKINAKKNLYFDARDYDVIYEYPISLKELLIGGDIEVPTPDGKKVKLSLEPNIRQGKMLKVKGKGLSKGNGVRGDLLVRIKYHIPEKISAKADKILDDLMSLPGWTPKKDKSGFYRKE